MAGDSRYRYSIMKHDTGRTSSSSVYGVSYDVNPTTFENWETTTDTTELLSSAGVTVYEPLMCAGEYVRVQFDNTSLNISSGSYQIKMDYASNRTCVNCELYTGMSGGQGTGRVSDATTRSMSGSGYAEYYIKATSAGIGYVPFATYKDNEWKTIYLYFWIGAKTFTISSTNLSTLSSSTYIAPTTSTSAHIPSVSWSSITQRYVATWTGTSAYINQKTAGNNGTTANQTLAYYQNTVYFKPSTGYEYSGTTTVDESSNIITFVCTQNATALTLQPNGASGTKTVNVVYGSNATNAFIEHTRILYRLRGYYTTSSGGSKVINATGSLISSAHSLVASTSYTDSSGKWNYSGSALTLYAQWDQTYNVYVYPADESTGSTTGSAALLVGESTTITATPALGYQFDHWAESGEPYASITNPYSAETTVTLNSEHTATIYAYFTEIPAQEYGYWTLRNSSTAITSVDVYRGSSVELTYHTAVNLSSSSGINVTTDYTSYIGLSNKTLGSSYLYYVTVTGSNVGNGKSIRITYTSSGGTPYYKDLAVNVLATTYTIAFDNNGGSGSMSSMSCTYGVSYTLSSCIFTPPTGKVFGGWNTQSGGGGTSYADGATVSNLTTVNNATVTLYAQWTDVPMIAIQAATKTQLSGESPIIEGVLCRIKGTQGSSETEFSFTIPTVVQYDGLSMTIGIENIDSRFEQNTSGNRWELHDSDTGTSTYFTSSTFTLSSSVVTANHVYILYAIIHPIVYNVSFELNDGTVISGSASPTTTTASSRSAAVSFPTVAKDGYEFLMWTNGVGEMVYSPWKPPQGYTQTINVFSCNWVRSTTGSITVTYAESTSNEWVLPYNQDSVTYGGYVSLPGAMWVGSGNKYLLGWSESSASSGYTLVSDPYYPEDSITLYPKWAITSQSQCNLTRYDKLDDPQCAVDLTKIGTNYIWETSNARPSDYDSSIHGGVWQSTNHNVNNSYSVCKINLSNVSSFTIYINSYAESSWDYTIASTLDAPSIPTVHDGSYVAVHTRGFQYDPQGSLSSAYKSYTYTVGGGSHFIYVVYIKDTSVHSNNDRGYFTYLKPSGNGVVSTTFDLPYVQSIEQTDTVSVTTVSTLVYGFDNNFAMDMGGVRKLTLTCKRTQPLPANDSESDSSQWSNGYYFHKLKEFISNWQNLSYGPQGLRYGGFQFHYETPSSEKNRSGLYPYAHLFPELDYNVFVNGQISSKFSGDNLQHMTLNIPLSVASMRKFEDSQSSYPITYHMGLYAQNDPSYTISFPIEAPSIAPDPIEEWGSLTKGYRFKYWKKTGDTSPNPPTYQIGSRVPAGVQEMTAYWQQPTDMVWGLGVWNNDAPTYFELSEYVVPSSIEYIEYMIGGFGGDGGRWTTSLVDGSTGGGGSGGFKKGRFYFNRESGHTYKVYARGGYYGDPSSWHDPYVELRDYIGTTLINTQRITVTNGGEGKQGIANTAQPGGVGGSPNGSDGTDGTISESAYIAGTGGVISYINNLTITTTGISGGPSAKTLPDPGTGTAGVWTSEHIGIKSFFGAGGNGGQCNGGTIINHRYGGSGFVLVLFYNNG